MARERYLRGVSPEELRPPEPAPPPTPRGKWANFWEYHKGKILAGAAALAVVGFLIYQLVSRDAADYLIVVATQQSLADMEKQAVTAAFEEALLPYAADVDGDGKVEIAMEVLCLTETSQNGAIDRTKLTSHLMAADAMLFFLDQATYENSILPLQSEDTQFYLPLGVDAAGLSEDGRYWDWAGDSLRDDPALAALPEHLYFGVRDAIGTANAEECVQMRDAGLALLQAFLADK